MKDEKNNTGSWNAGDWNAGYSNTGNSNTGSWNTGDWNAGNSNTGSWNTGDWNAGNSNTGNSNTGSWNTGSWNTCNSETGFFNTTQPKTIRVFNKDCDIELWENSPKPDFIYFHITNWVDSDDMTEKEKEDNPTHETTGGYLKSYEYKEAFKNAYNEASKEDKELLLKLPNFDADVFYDISGIDVRKEDKSEEIQKLESELQKIQKAAREMQLQLDELKR